MDLILTIAGIHLLACLSPGPDVFLVILNSLRHGWTTGAATTSGILTGVSLQIALGLTGISYLLTRGPGVELSIALAGGAWLMYLGRKGFRRRPQKLPLPSPINKGPREAAPTFSEAWVQGLLTHILNPKAILYFLSLFSVMLGPEVDLPTKVTAGAAMILTQASAFLLVAVLSDRPVFKARWSLIQDLLDIAISLILFGIGLWIWIDRLILLAR